MQTLWKRLTCALLAGGIALASGAALAQPAPGRFTIAVIPDTQNYADFTHQRAAGFPFDARDMMTEQLQFIADHAASRGGDIVFATAVGDVWQHPVLAIDPDHAARGFRPRPAPGGADLEKMAEGVRTVEIPASIAAYDRIDGVLPFSVVSGNHDYDGQWWDEQWPQDLTAPAGDLRRLGMIHIGGLTAWNQAFGAESKFFRDRPWYVASHDGGADSAQLFEAGGYRFLHIGLQMAPSDASLKWAETVIHARPGLPTLITTHDFIDKTGQRRAHPVVDLHALDPFDNDAQAVWDKLIARNPQIFMVLSGHHNGQAFRTDANRQGGAVYQLLSDYQDRNQTALDAGLAPDRAPGIGDGWMRLMAFDMTGETPTVRVRAYSTHYRQYASDQPEYAGRYKPNEQPQMSDADFVASDDFVIRLEDFRARFGPGSAAGSAGSMSVLNAGFSRRALIGGLVAAPVVLRFGRARAGGAYLFPLGVASGDPWPDGFVLWTRLAVDPVAADGQGGLGAPVPVRWDVAADEGFSRIVASGQVTADAAAAHSVHVEVQGLTPGRPYWYRFTAAGQRSPVGLARTAPAPNADVDRLKLAVASCSNWEVGYFSAYGHMADEAPDLTLFLGDYIYEYTRTGARAANIVRRYGFEDATTLAGYRNRYALHRTDADLQRLHAAAPCLVVWDDHEVLDNYSGVWADKGGRPDDFLRRRAAGYQAFYEAMPIRRTRLDRRLQMPIHKRVRYGKLAEFFMLDGRQYRSRGACVDEGGARGQIVADAQCLDRADPSRTFLGFEQERWLYDGLAGAEARWNILGQDLVMAGLRFENPNGETRYWTDTWDGFPAARDRMTQALHTIRPRNPVVLAGDYHSFWTNDVLLDSRDERSPVVATEFVGTSITSGGPPYDSLMAAMPANPHIKFFDSRVRGYISMDVTPQRMTARYQAVSDVRDPKASLSTLKTWVVEDGRPGAQIA